MPPKPRTGRTRRPLVPSVIYASFAQPLDYAAVVLLNGQIVYHEDSDRHASNATFTADEVAKALGKSLRVRVQQVTVAREDVPDYEEWNFDDLAGAARRKRLGTPPEPAGKRRFFFVMQGGLETSEPIEVTGLSAEAEADAIQAIMRLYPRVALPEGDTLHALEIDATGQPTLGEFSGGYMSAQRDRYWAAQASADASAQ